MSTRDFGTELLRSLVAVVEEASYTKAALRLGISQPSVSSHIKKLSEHLGVDIFDKSTLGVRLTAHGETVLDHARRILRLQDNLAHELETSGSAVPRLRVGASTALLHGGVMDALAEFRRLHPEVNVQFHREMSARQIELLNGGELDVSLALTWHEPREEAFLYWYAPMLWLVPKGTPLPLKQPVEIIGHAASTENAEDMMVVLRNAGIDYRIVISTNDADTSTLASRAGLGISLAMLSRRLPDFMQVLGEESGLPPLRGCYWGVYLNPDTRSADSEDMSRLIARFVAHQGAEVVGV